MKMCYSLPPPSPQPIPFNLVFLKSIFSIVLIKRTNLMEEYNLRKKKMINQLEREKVANILAAKKSVLMALRCIDYFVLIMRVYTE